MDLDDFYSLTDYSRRFGVDKDKYIGLWISQISVLSLLELEEMKICNNLFRKDNVASLIKLIEQDEILSPTFVIDSLSLTTMIYEDGNILATPNIYYDFVLYLQQIGIVK